MGLFNLFRSAKQTTSGHATSDGGPSGALALIEQGNALEDAGQVDGAHRLYREAIALAPDLPSAHLNLGNALLRLGDFHAAIEAYTQALSRQPDYAAALFNLGNAHVAAEQFSEAVSCYESTLRLRPEFADAYVALGYAQHELGLLPEALQSYERALALKPDYAEAHYNRGLAYDKLEQYAAAIQSHEQAIALKPDYAEAHYSRGLSLSNLNQFRAAIQSYDRAISLKPDYAEAYNHRGLAYTKLFEAQPAKQSYERAIELKPDYVDALQNLGLLHNSLRQRQEAIVYFERVLALAPDYVFTAGLHFMAKIHLCDWRTYDRDCANLLQRLERKEPVIPGMTTLALTDSARLQHYAAEIWSRKFPPNPALGPLPSRPVNGKIRLGYFSMDFHNHPVSILTGGLYEAHNREDFEIFAFSYGPDVEDEMRPRLQAAFDHFIDVRDRSDEDIARLARASGIDIAIDLAGHTGEARTGIFALRAAPIQVNYLGYPGTMGADYMDYIIADPTAIPPDVVAAYTEKPVYLPCFQANDSRRVFPERVFSRQELKLPASGFVFCCFNNSYKLTPTTFDLWMRILKRVDHSVLFLFAENEHIRQNLCAEATRRGVSADRLVFGDRLSYVDNLARYQTADLFLDTSPFNAGTTASDALWAGLPVLTRTGEAFAGRMAASLLQAAGLPELITTTPQDYENLAVELATHPDRLGAMRRRLISGRLSLPLFDTARFTAGIERAYRKMHGHYLAGKSPQPIDISTELHEGVAPAIE